MAEFYDIPIEYKEGTYNVSELEADTKDIMELQYSEYGDIVTYTIPEREYNGTITLYSIPENVLDTTLKATYNNNGQLKIITIQKENKEMLLYIHYENTEDAKKEIESFARENAQCIVEKISMCKDLVSRLFIEYFDDGECMDFHAKIGTKAQKTALEEKYPDDSDIAEKAPELLNKADDFKFLCLEYD